MLRLLRWLAQLAALAIILLATKWLLVKLGKLAAKLIDNAALGWMGDVIGRWLGITSPTEQEVFEAIIEWGPPLLLLAPGLVMYHSLYTKAWVRGGWRPRPPRWGIVAVYTRLIDRWRQPKLISRTDGAPLKRMLERREAEAEESDRILTRAWEIALRDRPNEWKYSPPPSNTEGKKRR
jgi:hypothetical protein